MNLTPTTKRSSQEEAKCVRPSFTIIDNKNWLCDIFFASVGWEKDKKQVHSHHNSLTHSAAVTRNMSNEHLCNGGPEDGKQCGCRLTQEKLEAKESRLNNDICTLCGHHLGHHPAGPQGE